MPQRVVNTVNPGPEITDQRQQTIEFDGQRYLVSANPAAKTIVPDGAAVRENIKVDDSTSGLINPDTAPAVS